MGSRRADLDQLLEEADRALNADGEHVGSYDDDEGEVDALEQMARILKKNPVPAWTKLQKIVGPGDSNSSTTARRRADAHTCREQRGGAATHPQGRGPDNREFLRGAGRRVQHLAAV